MTLRVIVLLVIALLVVRAIRLFIGGIMIGAGGTDDRSPRSRGAAPLKLVRDPVCGTHVAPRPTLSITSGGTTHYFCSEECRRRFKA